MRRSSQVTPRPQIRLRTLRQLRTTGHRPLPRTTRPRMRRLVADAGWCSNPRLRTCRSASTGAHSNPTDPTFSGSVSRSAITHFASWAPEACCAERVLRRRIPAGARDFELAVKLRYKPARLYLKGPAPSRRDRPHHTSQGTARVAGRIREILQHPDEHAAGRRAGPDPRAGLSDLSRVGRDGFAPERELTEHSFTLETDAETP